MDPPDEPRAPPRETVSAGAVHVVTVLFDDQFLDALGHDKDLLILY